MIERLSNDTKVDIERLTEEELISNIQYAADRKEAANVDLNKLLAEYSRRHDITDDTIGY